MFEGKSAAYIAGFIVGILIVAIACLIIRLITKKSVKEGVKGSEFDERQLSAREKAAKIGFITLCCWEIFSLIMFGIVEITFIAQGVWHLLGLIIGLAVFVITCIWKDAYFSFSQANETQKIRFYVFTTIIAAINAAVFFVKGGFNRWIETGKISETSDCNFITALFLVVILINLFIKSKVDKRELQKSDEK